MIKEIILNKDIPSEPSNGDELTLNHFRNALETNIQQYFRQQTDYLSQEYEIKYKKKLIEFVQTDNGNTELANDLSESQKSKLIRKRAINKKRKKAEGTRKGWPDSKIVIGTPCKTYTKVIFVEAKRIADSMSQIKITPEQKYYNEWLNSIGFEAYITNNPVFFNKVILQLARDFIDQYL
jgi:hypothetical protein